MAIETSLFFTTNNRQDDCILCLNNLKTQMPDSSELFLLDDWHIKNEVLENYCKKNNFFYIHTGAQKNNKLKFRMPGYALNIGFKKSNGKIIVFGNAEIFLQEKNTLQYLITLAKTNTICSPKILMEEICRESNQYSEGNSLLPFFWAMPANIYKNIGGYDEDFTGYCFDDNDFSDRARSLAPFKILNSIAIHLWNIRGIKNRKDINLTNRDWHYNKNLYETRKHIIQRNKERSWGTFIE